MCHGKDYETTAVDQVCDRKRKSLEDKASNRTFEASPRPDGSEARMFPNHIKRAGELL
jgi:hypothetical protein